MKIKISYFHIGMTSLGYLQYSDINDSSTSNSFEMNKKINSRNRNTTIKNRSTLTNTDSNSISNENMKNMLNIINNSNGYDNEAENEDSSGLADFNPPPRAQLPKLKETNNEVKINNVEIDEEIPAVLSPSSGKMNNTKMNNNNMNNNNMNNNKMNNNKMNEQ
jgi:hypothetical protein